MKTDITRQPLGLILTQFILLLGLFIYRFTLHPDAAEVAAVMPGMPLGDWVNSLAAQYPTMAQAAVAMLVIVNAFLITRTLSRNLVFPPRTYIPAIFYLVTCCGIYYPGGNLAAVAVSYLLVVASTLFISSFIRSHSFGITFRAALFTGTAMLLHAPAAIYVLLVPVAVSVFRRSGREAFVAIIGSLIPISLCAYIQWAAGGGFTDIFLRLWQLITEPSGLEFTTSTPDIIRISIVGLLILHVFLSLGTFAATAPDLRTRSHKVYSFMIWFLLISIGGMLLPCHSVADIPATAIPVAFLLPAFFTKHTGRIPATLYILMMLSVVGLNVLMMID